MADKVALITGAGSGIGRATAIELARHQYRLALVGRTLSTLNETLALAGQNDSGLACPADIARPEDVAKAIQTTQDCFGRIDVLVNNAGLAPVLNIEQMTIEQWHAIIDTNLSAAFYFCKAAWPAFKQQGGGAIVNLSSAAARDPFPGFLAYGAAKAAVNLFSLSLAREGEPIGVRVYTVAPGAVETPMFRAICSPEQFPASKTLRPEDVARVIAQCICGDLRYSNGEVIHVHKELS